MMLLAFLRMQKVRKTQTLVETQINYFKPLKETYTYTSYAKEDY